MGEGVGGTPAPLVMVEWEDSSYLGTGWQEVPDIQDAPMARCRSVGWLIFDGEHLKVLVPHRHEDGDGAINQAGGMMQIPTRCIVGTCILVPASPASSRAA